MTLTAPSVSFSDLDLSDPDEQMKVTNNGTKDIAWYGVRRLYLLEPKKTAFVPFHVIIRYLGDPRSDYRKTETFETPSGDKGVIPERRGELFRLSVLYGLYHGKVNDLPKKAPKVTVVTGNDIPIDFPIFHPQGTRYSYHTNESAMIDARTEIERLTRKQQETDKRINELLSKVVGDDPEGDEAPEDTLGV